LAWDAPGPSPGRAILARHAPLGCTPLMMAPYRLPVTDVVNIALAMQEPSVAAGVILFDAVR